MLPRQWQTWQPEDVPAPSTASRRCAAPCEVFWARGYDGATLEELQTAMGGIAPPSFYAAFGSKDALFREAVMLYYGRMRERVMAALEAPTAKEGDRSVDARGHRAVLRPATVRRAA